MPPSQGPKLPKVSFIIPARNERDGIERSVLALLSQEYPPTDIEVVIAEGRSTDGTRRVLDAIASRDPRIKVVDNPSGRTPDALNAAIQASSGAFICRVDGHATVQRDHVVRCLHAIATTGAWCVGGRMVQRSAARFGRAAAAASGSRFGVGDSAFHYKQTAGPVESVYLGFWPRWVFERVGLFDPELLRNQDDELSFRIRDAGGVVWFDPSIQTAYRPRESWRHLFSQYRQYGKYKVRVFQKHLGAARPRHFVPAAWVASLMTAALTPFAPWLIALPACSVATYAATNLLLSLRVARRSHVSVVDIARAFLAMHAGYGIGFWQGLVAFAPRWLDREARSNVPRLLADE